MDRNLVRNWMWSEACEMLARADRLHREFFRPAGLNARTINWEPPVDILETDSEVLVLVALPGVNPDHVDAAIDGDNLIVTGTRILPAALQRAVIHRLELPQGRFERRMRLPAGRYSAIRRSASDGCLLITLEKSEASHG
jgi:HSP20 family protein